jgi:hypothetical protein
VETVCSLSFVTIEFADETLHAIRLFWFVIVVENGMESRASWNQKSKNVVTPTQSQKKRKGRGGLTRFTKGD